MPWRPAVQSQKSRCRCRCSSMPWGMRTGAGCAGQGRQQPLYFPAETACKEHPVQVRRLPGTRHVPTLTGASAGLGTGAKDGSRVSLCGGGERAGDLRDGTPPSSSSSPPPITPPPRPPPPRAPRGDTERPVLSPEAGPTAGLSKGSSSPPRALRPARGVGAACLRMWGSVWLVLL